MQSKKVIKVVAALIWRGDKFLICRRPLNKARGGLWEFVGGKVEKGESGKAALVRECMEELAITITPGSIFTTVMHEYPDIIVDLDIYNATITQGEPQLLEHIDLKWITKEQIKTYQFCLADEEILNKISIG
jgi:8-oxo-dGTP diphosphatase